MTSTPLSPGTTIGPYRILARIGAGGMGTVFKARDTRLDRDVALKVMSDELAADADYAARFEREARALAAINHPNIVTIHSVETDSARRFLTMELVVGEPLTHLIPPGGMAPDRLIDIGVAVADALAAAHEHGITHRDLKPGNIMVTADGRPKIVDFGLATRTETIHPDSVVTMPATRAGHVVGTLLYMSPEQVQGRVVDSRSDIFSLGAVFYEMAAGHPPFSGASQAEVIAVILRDRQADLAAVRPDLPDGLVRIVDRCLEKDPQQRFQSSRDLRHALHDVRRLGQAGSAGPAPVTATGSASRPAIRSLAILPLVNLSADASEDYLAAGLAAALTTDLAKMSRLTVISQSSVIRYRGSAGSASEIGRELGVDAVVEGSVLRVGSRVRISAQLVDVASGRHLWAERYDRELEDVLGLQDEVARTVAGEIDAMIGGAGGTSGATRPAAPPRKVDPDVYLLDLRGRHLWEKRTERGFRAALELFEEARDRDPAYAPAYVGIAESLNMLANYGLIPPRELKARSLAAVQKALQLDEHSSEAHRVLAFIHWQFDFRWQEAIREYERALELEPNSAVSTYWFGACCGVIGLFERSRALLDRAEQLDPLSLIVPSVQGWVRFFERRFDDALPYYRKVLRLDPDFHMAHWFMGETLVEMGRFDEGVASLERALDTSGRSSRLLGYVGYAYGRAGRTADASACLAELEEREQAGYVPPYFFALISLGQGQWETALDMLERALAEGDTMIRDLRADAQWDHMPPNPRFDALMARLAYPTLPAGRV
jgi:serine/threonine protein kinase/tetratricopeptide (TPR) repeat protein